MATIKGNGSGFMTPLTRIIRGVWKPAANELMRPSVTTKMCFLVAIAFLLLDANLAEMVYMVSVGLFVSVKLASVFGDPVDPFKPIEDFVFRLMGHATTQAG